MTRNLSLIAALVLGLAGVGFVGGCADTPKSELGKAELHSQTMDAIARVKAADPGTTTFFNSAVGYAVFPTVTKGGAGIGAAHGIGELFEGGKVVGLCEVSQATIGLQLGGQEYTEVIFFQTKEALASFKRGDFEFSGQASGAAIKAGGAANAKYEAGVLVITLTKGGLMGEASVGGQKFSVTPK